MTVQVKITEQLRDRVFADLLRPHPFAAERVGFISCRPAVAGSGVLLLASGFHAVADDDYLPDLRVGAMMGSAAIRKALQLAYGEQISMLHVHLHDHLGQPGFSRTDLRETEKFVPDFFHVRPELPHGALILSRDSAVARCWMEKARRPIWADKITIVGSPLVILHHHDHLSI